MITPKIIKGRPEARSSGIPCGNPEAENAVGRRINPKINRPLTRHDAVSALVSASASTGSSPPSDTLTKGL
jgi:hypothetical protein